MIDDKGRLFGKINLIDLFVVLVLVIIISGFAFKTLSSGETVTVTNDTPIEVTFKVVKVRDFTVNAVEAGDSIYERNGQKLGEVTEVRTPPAREILSRSDGSSVYAEVENRYDMLITVRGAGRISGGTYYLNSNRIMTAGSDIKLCSNKATFDASVYAVGSPQ